MLRPCRINPKISADAFLEGKHDYNAVPFPPLGWRILIFEVPENAHNGASMEWKDLVWAPQKEITDAIRGGSQQQGQKEYQIQ